MFKVLSNQQHFDQFEHTLTSKSLITFFLSMATSNGGTDVKSPRTFKLASFYSEVQTSRLNHSLSLPSVLRKPFDVVDGPKNSVAGNPDEIAKLFSNLFGKSSSSLVPNEPGLSGSDQKLKIGVVLSGGQAPGGHNVISGIFEYLQDRVQGSTLYGFKGGPARIKKGKYVELTSEFVYPYRNQVSGYSIDSEICEIIF